jgi:cell division protease FtsH
MTRALLDWETIDADQIDDIVNGRPPRPPKSTGSSPPAGGRPATGGVEGAAQPA